MGIPQLFESSFANVAIYWPTPNYAHPQTRGPELYIVNSFFLCAATFCVAIRLYTRISIRNWFGLDDLLISVALIAAIGVYSCVMVGVHDFDWDRHLYDIPSSKYEGMGKILYASRILWSIASISARASVCCSFYRLLDHSGLQKYRWVLHINTVFMLLLFLSLEMTTILECLPIKAIWTWPVMLESRCLDNDTSLLAQAALNTISEFLVACFPIPIVTRLNMPRSQRFAALGLLCLGFLVAGCGALRTYYLWLIKQDHDSTWWAVPHWIISEVEIDTALICACIPVLKPLYDRLRRGGWKAARKPNINENSHAFIDGNTIRMYQTLDLEGIANDGFGYTVTITGPGKEEDKKKRRKSSEQYSEMSLRSAAEKQRTLTFEMSELASMVLKLPQPTRNSSRSFQLEQELKGDPFPRHKSDIKIMEKKEFDVTESYEEGLGKNWDMRDHYSSRRTQQEDMETALHSADERRSASSYAESLTTDDSIQMPNREATTWQPISTRGVCCDGEEMV